MKMPKFKSESEEADWWYANRKAVERQLRAAEKARQGQSAAQILEEHKKRTQAISLRLPVTDIELAKVQAERKGLGYQTYLKSLIHEALTAK